MALHTIFSLLNEIHCGVHRGITDKLQLVQYRDQWKENPQELLTAVSSCTLLPKTTADVKEGECEDLNCSNSKQVHLPLNLIIK